MDRRTSSSSTPLSLKTARVFFAIKKNVDEIKREDYKEPKRQDEYGTSVISIQFSLDGSNTLSIKNRYNHSVNNPDATFSNNLDNIIKGLTKSFEEYYGIVQKHKNNGFEIPSYVRANDGKYYKYNYETGNKYFCPNNIIIDNYEVKRYAKEKYIVMDYFILDLEKKEISLYPNCNYTDSFIDGLKDIERIEIKKEERGKIIYLTPKVGEIIEIGIDNQNRIISYKNSNIKKIGDYFLFYNKNLINLNLSNVKQIGDGFLFCNEALTSLSLPNAEFIGDNFLPYNKKLISLNLPNVERIGENFLFWNSTLTSLSLPNVEYIGLCFLANNLHISENNYRSKRRVLNEKF